MVSTDISSFLLVVSLVGSVSVALFCIACLKVFVFDVVDSFVSSLFLLVVVGVLLFVAFFVFGRCFFHIIMNCFKCCFDCCL